MQYKNRTHGLKSLLAMVLALVMVISMVPLQIFAAEAMTDEQAVEDVFKMVKDFNTIKGENLAKNKINSPLYLPTEIPGYEGVSILWESSDPVALAPDGTITRQPYSGGQDVKNITLTVTVRKGEVSKSFAHTGITVLKITSYEVNLDKDVAWLQDTWAPQEPLTQHLTLPTKGEPGKTTIKWTSKTSSVITDKGIIYRGAPGTADKEGVLMAELSSGYNPKYIRTTELTVKIAPYTQEQWDLKNEKIKILTDLIDSIQLPEVVNSDNQQEVTDLLAPHREAVEQAHQAALDAGAMEDELALLPSWHRYQNAVKSLYRLPRTVTVSIVDVVKNGAGDYTSGPGYFLEKTKVVARGDKDGEASNEIASLMTDMKNAKLLGDKPGTTNSLYFYINGEKIGADGDYTWHYAINGTDKGEYSGLSSRESQTLNAGDNLVFFFAKEGDTTFLQGDYAVGLPEDYPVEYDFYEPKVFDANALTMESILNGNESPYSIVSDLLLPTKGKCGTSISWTTSNKDVITTKGVVTRPDALSSNASVRLTAKIGSEIYRDFDLTVLSQAQSTEEKTLAYALEQLTLPGLDAVTTDLVLPTEGFGGTTVTWQSSDPQIIGADGRVTRPEALTQVTLTAEVKLGELSKTKTFTATVLPAANDGEAVAFDKAALTFDTIKGDNLAETQIIHKLSLPAAGVMGSTITWSSDNEGALSAAGVPTRTDADGAVKLTAVITCGDASDTLVFELTVPALTPADYAKAAAEAAIEKLPEALNVSYLERKSATELLAAALTAVEDAKAAGVEEAQIQGIDRMEALATKLDRLPIEMTFSILGAEVKNKKMVAYTWFVEKCKLLVPKGSNLSDITKAVAENYDYVRPNTGSGYYGSFFGLGERDAGDVSGWIFGGAGGGIDPGQGCAASVPEQGSVAAWQFVGEWEPTIPKPDVQKEFGLIIPLPEDHPVDKFLVPPTDVAALDELIHQAEAIEEADCRDYGPWAGTWQAMQLALAQARKVSLARQSALDYEVNEAIETLRKALDSIQPNDLNTAELQKLVAQAEGLKAESYYEAGFAALQQALTNARKVLEDPYAQQQAVDRCEEELRAAMDQLIPTTQADKTELQALLGTVDLRMREKYSYASWQRVEAARADAETVMEDPNATTQQIETVTHNLQRSLNSLMEAKFGIKKANAVVYQAIEDWENTAEPWKAMDLVLLGYGHLVNRPGLLMNTAELLQSGRASVTDLERTAIVLTSLGYDATQVTLADGTKRDLIAEIGGMKVEDVSINALTFALLAADSGNYPAEALRTAVVDRLIATQNRDGGWPIYAGDASDLDMTGMTISALAPYISDARVGESLRKAADLLMTNKAKIVSTPKTYGGNCNTTAMCLIGAMAVPQYTGSILRESESGGLSHYATEGNQFGYQDKTTPNDLATEQGVRAAAVYAKFFDKGGIPVNGYQFDGVLSPVTLPQVALPVITTDLVNQSTSLESITFQVSAKTPDGRKAAVKVMLGDKELTGNGSYTAALQEGMNHLTITATGMNGGVTVQKFTVIREENLSGKTITVSFKLTGDTKHYDPATGEYIGEHTDPVWIPETSAVIPEGANAEYLTTMMLVNSGLSYTMEYSYLSVVNGLGAFDNGPNSGWMFLHNGKLAPVGVGDLILKDGDNITFFYTDDYTKETGNVDPEVGNVIVLINSILYEDYQITLRSEPSILAARQAYDALTEAQKLDVSNYGSLTWAESELARLKADAADRKAAQLVEEKIDAIGTVTEASAEKIREAREAYDALTDLQKQLVTNYETLTLAEARLALLSNPSFDTVYAQTGDALSAQAAQRAPEVGSIGGEWLVLGLARSGRQVPAQYYQNVLRYVQEHINDAQQLHRMKSTENSRLILALTAIGRDVTDVAGHNLLMGLTDMQYLNRQGINGPVWALIALDSHGYEIPVNEEAKDPTTRAKLISAILNAQHPDGGWALTADSVSDPDFTAMVLQALAPYYDTYIEVKAAVDACLAWLSSVQTPKDEFGAAQPNGTILVTTESNAQVLVALTALGIDPANDPRFVKNGFDVVDALCSLADGGSFAHVPGGKADPMATEQAYYAMAAYSRFALGKTSLYDMSDVTIIPGSGGMIYVTAGENNAYDAQLADRQVIDRLPLTDAEKAAITGGTDLTVTLKAEDITGSISDTQKAAIQKAAGEDPVGLYLDLILFKQLADRPAEEVRELSGSVTVSIRVPERLVKDGRTYRIVRLCEDEAQVLEGKFDPADRTLTFETDRFSTFALVYADEVKTPATGDGAPVAMLTLCALGALAAALYLLDQKKRFVR